MSLEKNLQGYIEDLSDDPEYLAEEYIVDITENIARIMKQKNISKSLLAKRLGTSQAYIAKILNGNPNMTILTIAKLSIALGESIIKVPVLENSDIKDELPNPGLKFFNQSSIRSFTSIITGKSGLKLSYEENDLFEAEPAGSIKDKQDQVA